MAAGQVSNRVVNFAGTISVAIFAHNEGERLRRAAQSVLQNAPALAELRVVLLVNGCDDDTPEIAEILGRADNRIVPIFINVGDKCNAWNIYVHEVACPSDVHFFMDGDCWCSPGSIALMANCLSGDSEANAVAGLPLGGWQNSKLQSHVKERRWVFGPLYGVRQRHMNSIRRHEIRLPIGLFGNDHVVTSILWSDDEFDRQEPGRVTWCEGAGYEWDRRLPWSPKDVAVFMRTQRRYRLRAFQLQELLGVPLKSLPQTMDAINRTILRNIRTGAGLRVPREIATKLSPSRWSVYDIGVLNWLKGRYPMGNENYFGALLDGSSWCVAQI